MYSPLCYVESFDDLEQIESALNTSSSPILSYVITYLYRDQRGYYFHSGGDMTQQKKSIADRIAHPGIAFVSGLVGGFVAFLFAFRSLLLYLIDQGCALPGYTVGVVPASAPSGSDVVAVANTYIVYTTIIFVSATIVLTLLAVYFGWQFSHDKEQQFDDRIAELRAHLTKNGETSKQIIEAALDNPEAGLELTARVKVIVNSVLAEAVNKGVQKQEIAQELVQALKPTQPGG